MRALCQLNTIKSICISIIKAGDWTIALQSSAENTALFRVVIGPRRALQLSKHTYARGVGCLQVALLR